MLPKPRSRERGHLIGSARLPEQMRGPGDDLELLFVCFGNWAIGIVKLKTPRQFSPEGRDRFPLFSKHTPLPASR